MHEQLAWSDRDLLRPLLVLNHKSWPKRDVIDDKDTSLIELKAAFELIYPQFRDPFEAAQVCLAFETRSNMQSTTPSNDLTWVVLTTKQCGNLPKVLQVGPMSCFYGIRFAILKWHIFFTLKIINSANRTSLSKRTLDDLLKVFFDRPPPDCFSADSE